MSGLRRKAGWVGLIKILRLAEDFPGFDVKIDLWAIDLRLIVKVWRPHV